MEDLTPQAPIPSSDNLVDHQHLELQPSSQTGLETLLNNTDGYIVGRLNNELLRYSTDAHLLTVSPTGGGKTTGVIIPNLLDHQGSSFVIDIRGETVAKTADMKRLQGHHVVVLDPYDLTGGKWGKDSYNPLDRITNNARDLTSDDRIQRLAGALMYDPSGRMSNEPIWDNATKNLLIGLIAYCVRYLPSYKHSLLEILDILNYSPQELEGFLAQILYTIDNDNEAAEDRQLKSLIKTLTEGKTNTKITDNALIQAQTLMTWVGNRAFKDIIEPSTFSFSDFRKRKMTVYLVIPEEFIENCASWTRLMIESAIFSQEDVFKKHGQSTSSLQQQDRVLFLLDELPAFGQLDVISKGMATLRGRGINLWLFVQNLAQLNEIYGEHKARMIIANASVLQLFRSNELEELEYFTKLISEDFFDIKTVSFGETITEGSSVSHGRTHTITNSQSVAHMKGSGDSIAESSGFNWTDTDGTSSSKAVTHSKGFNHSHGTSIGSSKGSNRSYNSTYERNLIGSSRTNDNHGNGFNVSYNKSRNYNEGWNEQASEAYTTGENHSRSQGGNKSSTFTHNENKSITHTRQSGTSDATTKTESTNKSRAVNRNVSVKKERLKIESIRSLREKLSERNQLIQVRGQHPFFTPRMSYFIKFSDANRYIFPDLASAVSTDALEEIIDRFIISSKEITKPGAFSLKNDDDYKQLVEYVKQREDFDWQSSEVCNEILKYPAFFNTILDRWVNKLKKFEELLTDNLKLYDEIFIVAIVTINAIKNTKKKDAEVMERELHSIMQVIKEEQVLSKVVEEKSQMYRQLPIINIEESKYLKHLNAYKKASLIWVMHSYLPLIVRTSNDILAIVDQSDEMINTKAKAFIKLGGLLKKVNVLKEVTMNNNITVENELRADFLSNKLKQKI